MDGLRPFEAVEQSGALYFQGASMVGPRGPKPRTDGLKEHDEPEE